MPHLTVEYSANLAEFPQPELLKALNLAVTSSPEVLQESDLKTRLVAHHVYAVGTAPQARAFVHAQLRLLAGRTPDAKADLTRRIADVLRRHTPQPADVQVQLSVEIVDMDRPSYIKETL